MNDGNDDDGDGEIREEAKGNWSAKEKEKGKRGSGANDGRVCYDD